MLAKSKLDSFKTLVSQAVIEIEISHEEFNATIWEEKKKNERMKENVRNVSEKQENMKLNSVNSRKITCDWLKVLNIYTIKTFFFVCIYKNDYICSIHCRTMEKDDVEVIESGGEI